MRWGGVWLVSAILSAGCTEFVSATEDTQTGSGSADASGTSTGAAQGTTAASDSLGGGSSSTDASDATTTTTLDPATDGIETDGDDAVCGNGRQEPGEECDDGNTNERDGCSTRCTSASCEDGERNGDETDVDCGGSCLSPCEVGEGCRATRDCDGVVCDLRRNVCAEPSCTDGLLNQGELSIDCGAVCNTAPTNVIVNGGFEMNTTGWDVVAPEVNEQNAYFGDGSENLVMEIDAGNDTTSSWTQAFDVSADDVDQVRTLTFHVGDRNGQSGDEGGLLIRIFDPGGTPLPLQGISGAGFVDEGGNQLAVDALQTGAFALATIQFTPATDGEHRLELLEQTDGPGLGNGGGIVVDDVGVSMIACE
ncbi:MAG: hypothetical protein ACE37F_33955 [Nannocystaceae bacterium]|nr:hypothetical protein [bacterium]